jgi:hypothetical protein
MAEAGGACTGAEGLVGEDGAGRTVTLVPIVLPDVLSCADCGWPSTLDADEKLPRPTARTVIARHWKGA